MIKRNGRRSIERSPVCDPPARTGGRKMRWPFHDSSLSGETGIHRSIPWKGHAMDRTARLKRVDGSTNNIGTRSDR
jgi:hypothetical protein